MNHEAMKEKVFALHDGELALEERGEVESHLAACASCRGDLAAWKESAALFFRAPSVTPSEAFVRAVMEKVEGLPVRESLFEKFRDLVSPPRLVFAGAAALALSFALWPDRPREPGAGVRHAMEILEDPASPAAQESGPEEAVEEYFL